MFNIINDGDFRLLAGKTAGRAFLFFGDEDYLKAAALREMRRRICPDEAFALFNCVTLDALEYSAEKLLDAISAPPMMSEERLVVVRDVSFEGQKQQGEREALEDVIAQLSDFDYTTLVICAAAGSVEEGNLQKNRPSPTLKKWQTVLTPVLFAAPTEARLVKWATQHFAHLGVRAAPDVCSFLVAFAGHSMYVLAGEIEKTAYFVLAAGRNTVSEADVRAAAVPAAECDAFGLSNALLAADYAAALSALSVMKFERVAPEVVLGEIARTLSDMCNVRRLLDAGRAKADVAAVLKIHEYRAGLLCRAVARVDGARLSRAVRLCAEADAALKRSFGDYMPIERLICAL